VWTYLHIVGRIIMAIEDLRLVIGGLAGGLNRLRVTALD